MESLQEILDLVFEKLQESMNPTAYAAWIKGIEPLKMEGSTVYLQVQTQFKRDQIIGRYLDLIATSFEEVVGFPVEVVIQYKYSDSASSSAKPAAESFPHRYTPEEMEKNSAGGDYDYTFSTFIVGPSNKFAHAASLAVATNPAGAYNPLFIWGGSGLGKTHLLGAIQFEIHKNFPDYNIVYVDGEKFTNEIISAIHDNTTAEFHNKYRAADVLLVDDIQFIAGKESTQEEFFHTFNSLYSANKQIIISSDKPPKDMEILDERFRSRFEWGLIVDITLPDYETRMAILHKKEDMDGYNVSEDVIKYIANNIKSNIRELEGAFNKVVAYAKLEKKEVTLELAEQALKDIVAPNENKQITADYIISMVAEHFNVSTADLCGNKRSSKIVMPRQVAMYLCREILAIPLKNVGQYLGNRDHTTVMHGVEKIEKELQNNEQLQNTIDTLKKKINPQG